MSRAKLTYMIRCWMLLSVVLLTACSSGGEDEEISPVAEDCFLDIYIYSPGRPIVTRADVGEIPSSEDERKVNTLKIWVFKTHDGSLVGYTDEVPTLLNESAVGQQKFRIKVSNTFADNPENVDVYVVANAESCGLSGLGEGTTRETLDNAKIGKDYFGTSSLVSKVPTEGLPMSAVLKNSPVSGRFPTLRIGAEGEMATLQLTRAVSRLRFVLCRIQEEQTTAKKLTAIGEISLNENMIPTEEHLFQPGTAYAYSYYVTDPVVFVDAKSETKRLELNSIPTVVDPMVYAYETQTAQEYETLIDNAVAGGTLKQVGLTYFRESDKQLKGTIKYTYSQNVEEHNETVTFQMAAPGDFLRNHSWIVYIYYLDSKIHVLTVTDIGMKDWVPDNADENLSWYNW